MFLATMLCWGAFLIVIFSVDPFKTTSLGFVLFYLSLFLSTAGSLSILGFIMRYIFNKNQFINHQVITSFRQGVLLGLLIAVALYLQSNGLIAWWNLLLLVILLVCVEIYFVWHKDIQMSS